jgi:deazaflavin-dependent oxidoreductase (nitroreductase family)
MADTSDDAFKQFNQGVIREFRSKGGKVGGQFANAPMLLLTTIGAKSGRPHTTPLVYSKDGNRIVIIASKGGAPKHPAWYHNLLANPTVTVEIGSERFEARAVATKGEERERLFRHQAEQMPQFNEYQKRTSRQIPVLALERI